MTLMLYAVTCLLLPSTLQYQVPVSPVSSRETVREKEGESSLILVGWIRGVAPSSGVKTATRVSLMVESEEQDLGHNA